MTYANGSSVGEAWPSAGLETLGRCPVCGTESRSLLYQRLRDRIFFCAPGEWTLYECSGCRCWYLDPRPTEATISLAYSSYFTHHPSRRPDIREMGTWRRFQRSLANGYRNWRYGTQHQPASPLGVAAAFLLPRQRALMDSELRHLPRPSRGARVLDIGCGDGAFLDWARAAGWDAFGIDFDPGAVASARSRGLDVTCGTLESVSWPPESFDAITISHVIEHVPDPVALIERSRDLLKPGGLLWVDTPNIESSGHRVFREAWLGLDPPRHLVLFSPSSLRMLLMSAGFEIVRTVSRFEVCERIFIASDRVATGRDPFQERAVRVPVRLRARLAAWRARLDADTSEFITILAARKR